MSVLELPELETLAQKGDFVPIREINCRVINLKKLKYTTPRYNNNTPLIGDDTYEILNLDSIETVYLGSNVNFGGNNLRELNMPNLHYIENPEKGILCFAQKLRVLRMGELKRIVKFPMIMWNWKTNDWKQNTSVIHVEIGCDGGKTNINLNFKNTYFGSNSIQGECFNYNTDLVEEPDKFSDNAKQFMHNFKMYIVDRLYDRVEGGYTTKLTLTIHNKLYYGLMGLDSSGNFDENSYSNTLTLEDLYCLTEHDISFHGYTSSTTYREWMLTIFNKIGWGLAYV